MGWGGGCGECWGGKEGTPASNRSVGNDRNTSSYSTQTMSLPMSTILSFYLGGGVRLSFYFLALHYP